MNELDVQFEFPSQHSIQLTAGASDEAIEAAMRTVPARWGITLLTDENERPVQLVCLKDLRAGLRHRLQQDEALAPSGRRVNWRELVRTVRWQLVESDFEADWLYILAARRFFPEMYGELMRPNQAWFVHVDSDAAFPKYAKTTEVKVGAGGAGGAGEVIGPFVDKHAAARFIEMVEDAFDLCRYQHILTQYPSGKACAYKEMGKCPAPCDGSISIEMYRRMIDWSVAGLGELPRLIAEQTRRMEQAALELRFETAGKIRAFVDQLNLLGAGAFKHARRIGEFSFVSVQKGPGDGKAKVFLILPGRIGAVGSIIGEMERAGEMMGVILKGAEEWLADGRVKPAAEMIGMVGRHLFAPKKKASGVFVPLAELTEERLVGAYREVMRESGKRRISPSLGTPGEGTRGRKIGD